MPLRARCLLLLPALALAACARPPDPPVVYLLGVTDGLDAVAATACLTATGRGDVVLFDTPAARPTLPAVVRGLRPSRVVAIGRFVEDSAGLSAWLGVPVDGPLTWERGGPPVAVWERAMPRAAGAVVCDSRDPAAMLAAAEAAGLRRVPLCPVADAGRDGPVVRDWLARWGVTEVTAFGAVGGLDGVRVVSGY